VERLVPIPAGTDIAEASAEMQVDSGPVRDRPCFLFLRIDVMKKLILMLIPAVLLGSMVFADSLSLSFFQNSTGNLFQNTSEEKDWLSVFSFSFEKDISGFGLFTQGRYSHFYENPELSYYSHDIGLDRVWAVRPTTAIYVSLSGKGGFFRSEYTDFNYSALNLYSAFKSYLRPTSVLKADYSIEYRNYRESLFDSVSHEAMVSLEKYFQTKTTLKAETAWGYKMFLHPFLTETEEPGHGTQGMGAGFSGNGYGKGPYKNRPEVPIFLSSQEENGGIQVLSVGGLLSQGLGTKIGLRLAGTRQWIVSGENPYGSAEEYYSFENPTYDRFSWEGYETGLMLSMLVPWHLQVKIGYNISAKSFPGIAGLNLEGEVMYPVRKDDRREWSFRVEKNFSRLSLFFSSNFIDNRSNDPFFVWKSGFVSLGIEWNFYFTKSDEK
jgi:hypothetical protein